MSIATSGSHVVWAGWVRGGLWWLRDDTASGIWPDEQKYSLFLSTPDEELYGRQHMFCGCKTFALLAAWEFIDNWYSPRWECCP
jgi:hypothetical protein